MPIRVIDSMQALDGVTYRVSHASESKNPALREPVGSGWSGAVTATSERGRLDVEKVDGKDIFGPGDYVLFDRQGAIVVTRTTASFVEITPSAAATAAVARVTVTARDLKWAIETLGDGGSIAGHSTVHCRARATYTLDIGTHLAEFLEPGEVPSPRASVTVDYWYAQVAGLPDTPITPFAAGNPMSALGPPEVATMWTSIADRLKPRGVSLRTRTFMRVVTGDIETVATSEGVVSDIHETRVDAARLMVPAGFAGRTAGSASQERWHRMAPR